MPTKTIEIHTDGACLGNPGPGGFGITIDVDGEEQRFGGGEAHTTNNRMELTAALTAIKIVKSTVPGADKREVKLHTNSRYVTDTFNQDWLMQWKARNLRNAHGNAIKNQDLWEEMIQEVEHLNITFQWVKEHNDDPANEVCDKMAKEQARRYIDTNSAGDKQQPKLPRATAAPSQEQPTGPSLREEQARIEGYEACKEELNKYLYRLESGPPPTFRDYVDGYRDCRGHILEFIQRMKGDVLPF